MRMHCGGGRPRMSPVEWVKPMRILWFGCLEKDGKREFHPFCAAGVRGFPDGRRDVEREGD
jgi:hypothetical protein